MLDEGVRVGAISATHLVHAQIRKEFRNLAIKHGRLEAIKIMATKYKITDRRVRQLVD